MPLGKGGIIGGYSHRNASGKSGSRGLTEGDKVDKGYGFFLKHRGP